MMSLLGCLLGGALAAAQTPVDVTSKDAATRWRGMHDVGPLSITPQGLEIPITGSDPYIHSPVVDVPPDQLLWLDVRIKSEQGGMLQIFYFDKGTSEDQSVRMGTKKGWNDLRLPLPPLKKCSRLRIDPPGDGGTAVLAKVEFSERTPMVAPKEWPAVPVVDPAKAIKLEHGNIAILHDPQRLGCFDVLVDGKLMARGFGSLPVASMEGKTLRWNDDHWKNAHVTLKDGELTVSDSTASAKGRTGMLYATRFMRSKHEGAIDVEVTCMTAEDKQLAFVPMLMLACGAGSYGTSKNQALFPGLEYLDKDEPSSSEADIVGPGSKRQVPDELKITMPLMAMVADDRYIAMTWEMQNDVAAVFDSPDRIFKSGGSVMGLIAPGSDGKNRDDGSILPYAPMKLPARTAMVVKATIFGGKAKSADAAVAKYVAMKGLPPLPKLPIDLKTYAKTAAAGWLDSAIYADGRFAHAWPGSFKAQPAADAAYFLRWLEPYVDPADKQRLRAASDTAIKNVPPPIYNLSGVGHVRYPLASLVFGSVLENVRHLRHNANETLKRFEPDGSVIYKQGAAKMDFGKTHFAPDANGLTSQLVERVLVAACVTGDARLRDEGLRLLRALDKFDHSAPRGAQTWEMPLHCPDILASAHLIKCYVMGYELTGEERYLGRARYWAWTGVPFIYLRKPAQGEVGPYAAIVCWGATQWVAPNWMGLPVQWCGVNYADALYTLVDHDPAGPWKQLADGIVISAIGQTHPLGTPKRVGLLPDSYALRDEHRNDAAINPGTVQALAPRVYGVGRIYDFKSIRDKGLLIHAPGEIRDLASTPAGVSFKVAAWPKEPCYILIAGLKAAPAIRIDGQDAIGVQYEKADGIAIVKITGQATVEIKADSAK